MDVGAYLLPRIKIVPREMLNRLQNAFSFAIVSGASKDIAVGGEGCRNVDVPQVVEDIDGRVRDIVTEFGPGSYRTLFLSA